MKIECPKCHQHYEIDESHIGQEIECGCGERIRISLMVESGRRSKRKASFFQIFVCAYLILILVCVCGGIGWGYSEIKRLNKNLYGAQGKMTHGISGILNDIGDEVASLKSDVSELKGATNGDFADNLSKICEEQKRIDKNIQGLYNNQQLLFTWCKTQDKRLWGEVPSILTGNSLWGRVSDLKTQASNLEFELNNLKRGIAFDLSGLKTEIDAIQADLSSIKTNMGFMQIDIGSMRSDISTITLRLKY